MMFGFKNHSELFPSLIFSVCWAEIVTSIKKVILFKSHPVWKKGLQAVPAFISAWIVCILFLLCVPMHHLKYYACWAVSHVSHWHSNKYYTMIMMVQHCFLLYFLFAANSVMLLQVLSIVMWAALFWNLQIYFEASTEASPRTFILEGTKRACCRWWRC